MTVAERDVYTPIDIQRMHMLREIMSSRQNALPCFGVGSPLLDGPEWREETIVETVQHRVRSTRGNPRRLMFNVCLKILTCCCIEFVRRKYYLRCLAWLTNFVKKPEREVKSLF